MFWWSCCCCVVFAGTYEAGGFGFGGEKMETGFAEVGNSNVLVDGENSKHSNVHLDTINV